MQCVILTGGLGTRMFPFTKSIPKAMLDVNGKPFIHHQLTYFQSQGIKDILLCVGHMGNMIEEYVQENNLDAHLNINFINDGDKLLGTGGALRRAYEENLLQDKFFLTYGDSYLPVDFKQINNHYVNDFILMTIYRNNNKLDNSNVMIKDDGNIYYDKNPIDNLCFTHIDYGLSIIPINFVEKYIPKNKKYDLSSFFRQLSEEKKVLGYEVSQRFYEIGSPQGYKDLVEYLKNN